MKASATHRLSSAMTSPDKKLRGPPPPVVKGKLSNLKPVRGKSRESVSNMGSRNIEPIGKSQTTRPITREQPMEQNESVITSREEHKYIPTEISRHDAYCDSPTQIQDFTKEQELHIQPNLITEESTGEQGYDAPYSQRVHEVADFRDKSRSPARALQNAY